MEDPVERAAYARRPVRHNVRVNHRRADVGMAEQFLNGADVVAHFQQMGGEARAQRMTS